jgi:6-phosphogluconolactonase
MPDQHLAVLGDAEALAHHAAGWIVSRLEASSGRFALNLSGGSTPKRLYQMLAQPPFRDRIAWDRVHLFWGDERFVAHDDPASNYGMTREALIAHVPIPPGNVHPIAGTGDLATAARDYERELQAYYGAGTLDPARPLFDITLLGLGDNGHTASLFPDTPSLSEMRAWATPVTDVAANARITLTYPVLDSSRAAVFLVAGAAKRDVLARVRAGDTSLPAARVRPVGTLLFFADRAAAGGA